MKTVPKDGTPIRIKTSDGQIFRVVWTDGDPDDTTFYVGGKVLPGVVPVAWAPTLAQIDLCEWQYSHAVH